MAWGAERWNNLGWPQEPKVTQFKAFDMGPLRKVSPVIKTARWVMLTFGIIYGFRRYQHYKALQDIDDAEEAIQAPIREAAAKAEYEKKNREALLTLARITHVPVPDGY